MLCVKIMAKDHKNMVDNNRQYCLHERGITMKQEDGPLERAKERQYLEHLSLYGGFSMAKIVLSNALPSSLYYPDPNGDTEGKT